MELRYQGDFCYIIYVNKGIKKRTPSFKDKYLVINWLKENNIPLWVES